MIATTVSTSRAAARTAYQTCSFIVAISDRFAESEGWSDGMPILTEDMKRVVREQRLGFYATVCEDGSPNLSPKGATYVLDDDRLFFADIRSPRTVANVRRGSLVEVNVVDPFARKGYRFKGPAVVYEPGSSLFETGLERLREAGSVLVDRARAIGVIEVHQARPLVSPVYDDGVATESEVIRMFQLRFAQLHKSSPS